MWLPGAGVGGEDLTAKGAKKRGLTTKGTKFTKFKRINISRERAVSFRPSFPRRRESRLVCFRGDEILIFCVLCVLCG